MKFILITTLLISGAAWAECPDLHYFGRASVITHNGQISRVRSKEVAAPVDNPVETLSEFRNREEMNIKVVNGGANFIIILQQDGQKKVGMWAKVNHIQCRGNELIIDKNKMNPPQLYDLRVKIDSVKTVDTCKADRPVNEVQQISLEFIADAKVADASPQIILVPKVTEPKNCEHEKTRSERFQASVSRFFSRENPAPAENPDAVFSLH